jgi:hypothetical protein
MPTNGQPAPLDLGDLIECLVQGPPPLKPIERPPAGFRVRAWQDEDQGKLQLRVAGLKAADWKVEVAFDDADPNDRKKVKPKQATRAEGEEGKKDEKDLRDDLPQPEAGVEFDLPKSWKQSSGARFVTVYLRRKAPASDEVNRKKRQEEPTTIIRIIPAPVRQSTTDEFGELDSPGGTDD